MRRAARWLWVPAALLAVAAGAQEPPAGAAAVRIEPLRIVEVRFVPPRFTVGDPVELHVVLAGTIDPRAPQPAAAASALDRIVIDRLELVPLAAGRYRLSVAFRSFQPGAAALPAIDLGGGTLLELPEVQTAATLPDDGGELEPAPGPMALPGTALRVAIIAALLLVGPLAAAVGTRPALRVLGRLLASRRRRAPRLRFERDLRALAGTAADGASYSAAVARLTRRFLASRLQVPARSKTAAELPALLAGAGLTPHTVEAATMAVADTERFTFGGAPLEADGAAALAAQARAAVAAAERELADRRSAGDLPERQGERRPQPPGDGVRALAEE